MAMLVYRSVVALFELPSLKSSFSHSHYLDQAVGTKRFCFVLPIIYVTVVEYILADINFGCCTIWFAGGLLFACKGTPSSTIMEVPRFL